MTRFEQIAAAFPLHAQRIAEVAGQYGLARMRRLGAMDDAGEALADAFTWHLTIEGHNYWRSLAEGQK